MFAQDLLKVFGRRVVLFFEQLAHAQVMPGFGSQRIIGKSFEKFLPLVGGQVVNGPILKGDRVAKLAHGGRGRFRRGFGAVLSREGNQCHEQHQCRGANRSQD